MSPSSQPQSSVLVGLLTLCGGGAFFGTVLTQKKCPVSVSIKAIESDKDKILSTFRASSSNTATSPQQPTDAPANGNGHADETTTPTGALPPMKYNFENAEGDGWVGFNKDICFVYAGKGPYVARDLMQFPVSLPNDGAVDVVVQELVRFRFPSL